MSDGVAVALPMGKEGVAGVVVDGPCGHTFGLSLSLTSTLVCKLACKDCFLGVEVLVLGKWLTSKDSPRWILPLVEEIGT
uniref:Uncharacterized protein n=1 Tax=Ditylenchus dipsaci TaxID=166011 RepID=A0A915DGB5_9BILA